MKKEVITWNRADGKVSYCRAMTSLPLISRALVKAFSKPLVQALPACLQICVLASLPSLSLCLAPQTLPTTRGPTLYSHCLESGVTFSMSSMKFFRNSVLLSEAFKSLQYSLGVGEGQEEQAWEAALSGGVQASRRCPDCREGRECSQRLWSP